MRPGLGRGLDRAGAEAGRAGLGADLVDAGQAVQPGRQGGVGQGADAEQVARSCGRGGGAHRAESTGRCSPCGRRVGATRRPRSCPAGWRPTQAASATAVRAGRGDVRWATRPDPAPTSLWSRREPKGMNQTQPETQPAPQHVYRQRSPLVIAVLFGLGALVLLGSAALSWRDHPQPLFVSWLVWGCAALWAVFVRPSVVLTQDGVRLSNVVREVEHPLVAGVRRRGPLERQGVGGRRGLDRLGDLLAGRATQGPSSLLPGMSTKLDQFAARDARRLPAAPRPRPPRSPPARSRTRSRTRAPSTPPRSPRARSSPRRPRPSRPAGSRRPCSRSSCRSWRSWLFTLV